MLDFSDMQGFSFQGGSNKKPKTRMAGDYMADFTKSNSTADTPNVPAVNNIESSKNKLIDSFYKDYGSFNTSSKGSQSSSSNNTSPSPSPAATNTGTSTSAPTTDSSAWLNGVPSAAERTQMYYDSLNAEQQAKFDTKHYSLNAQKQRVGEAKSHRDNISSNFQNDEAEFTWAAGYTGPKTFEEAGKINATDGAESIASYLGQINRYNNAMNKQKKLQEQYINYKGENSSN